VGYGRTWVAARPSAIGLVPVGYADGFRRVLSNRGEVLVHGVRCRVVGRVSMDQFGIDVTEVEGVSEGDEVVMIGRQGGEKIGADEVARWADTISYEIFTGLPPRVPRRYVKNGVTVSTRSLLGGENPQQAEGFPKEPRK
jgi:alanine racemase